MSTRTRPSSISIPSLAAETLLPAAQLERLRVHANGVGVDDKAFQACCKRAAQTASTSGRDVRAILVEEVAARAALQRSVAEWT